MLRLAEIKDEQQFLEIALEFLSESRYPFKADEYKIRSNFLDSLDSPDIITILYEKDNQVVGALVGGVGSTLFSNEKVATELMWYVKPEYRGTVQSIKMVKEYEAWAQRVGCSFVTMTYLSDLNDMEYVYERMGYNKVENTFAKRI